MVSRFDWQKQAACANPDYDPEWWFAPKDSPEATAAQGICMYDCPVYEQCEQYTRDVDLRAPGGITGIWGWPHLPGAMAFRREAGIKTSTRQGLNKFERQRDERRTRILGLT